MNCLLTRRARDTSLYWVLLTAAATLGAAACGATDNVSHADPETGEQLATGGTGAADFADDDGTDTSLLAAAGASAASPPVSQGTWIDDSGTVHLELWRCVGPMEHAGRVDAACTVPAGQVLVGGGAAIVQKGGPGAILVASHPDPDLRSWRAASKDHLVAQVHTLDTYAIGLRLEGLSEASLRSQMHVGSRTSNLTNHPETTAFIPPDYVLVGGGAATFYAGAGLLLVASKGAVGRPGGWYARAKDHGVADIGTVRAYTVSVKRCPTGYRGGCLVSSIFQAAGTAGFDAQSVILRLYSPHGAVTSVGGEAASDPSGAGRLLAHMFPIPGGQGGAVTWSKDHQIAASGHSIVHAVALTGVPIP
jgi:hypothetical protein